MKGILLFTLALMGLSLGCIKSEETPYKTHAPPVITSSKTISLHANDSAEIKQFFEVKCSLCHPLSYITTKRKNYDDWLMTAYSMKNHRGVLITEEEVLFVAQYINESYSK